MDNYDVKDCAIAKRLHDKLPYGSGLNYDWHIEFTQRRVYCHNNYDAMNENGMYCHVYPVVVTFARGHECYNCGGHGVLYTGQVPFTRTKCPDCKGLGYIADRDNLFLLDARIKGRELSCCGYGLNDYLSNEFFESGIDWNKTI